MSDLWSDVSADIMRRLNQHAPAMPFEMKIIVAEDAARDVGDYATPFPDGSWPLQGAWRMAEENDE